MVHSHLRFYVIAIAITVRFKNGSCIPFCDCHSHSSHIKESHLQSQSRNQSQVCMDPKKQITRSKLDFAILALLHKHLKSNQHTFICLIGKSTSKPETKFFEGNEDVKLKCLQAKEQNTIYILLFTVENE